MCLDRLIHYSYLTHPINPTLPIPAILFSTRANPSSHPSTFYLCPLHLCYPPTMHRCDSDQVSSRSRSETLWHQRTQHQRQGAGTNENPHAAGRVGPLPHTHRHSIDPLPPPPLLLITAAIPPSSHAAGRVGPHTTT